MGGNPRSERMIADQLRPHGIVDPRVLEVMRQVPREEFVQPEHRDLAYADHPLAIGGGQTISQPLVVAAMTQAADPRPGEVALEVGSGSGYQAAVLARLCDHVVGVERDAELAARGERTLARLGFTNAEIHHGDGAEGWPGQAPYAVIIVSAAADNVPPALVEQLAEGGRLVIPVVRRPDAPQDLLLIRKLGGRLETKALFPVTFVPLVEGTRG
ncbi:MAG TPA: protein-L-isoaspartate(D-aspartate) O-methyltransferase [Candidatus Dormibacteraeota bacterium]|nr:protein-L-isoaspartate(D-aspartate) O-methyltransferase [Candidatus Dormibacteraeota bacterium]